MGWDMYQIVLGLDGKYYCICRVQDGTERWTESDLETAVTKVKEFAKVMNGTKIKRKEISFFKEIVVQKSEYVPWDGK